MWIAGLIVLGVVLAAGVWLMVTGLRGRVVDDHPVCRACGFDLVGVYPDVGCCPECGGKLGNRTTRISPRVRRRSWIVTGMAATIAALLVGLGTLSEETSTANWNSFMPTGLLIRQAQQGSPKGVRGAVEELTLRFEAGDLVDEQIDRIKSSFLKVQRDRSRTWDPVMGDFIEVLQLQGYLTPEEYEKYLRRAISIKGVFQNRVHAGHEVALGLVYALDRGGTKTEIGFRKHLEYLRLNMKRVPLDHSNQWNLVGMFSAKSRLQQTIMRVPLSLEPGMNEIRLSNVFTILGPNIPGNGSEPIYKWYIYVDGQVELVPDDEPLVHWVSNTTIVSRFKDDLTIKPVKARHTPDNRVAISPHILSKDRPVALAMDVFIKFGDQEHFLYRLSLPPGNKGIGKTWYGGLDAVSDKGTVILRPSEDALSTLNVEEALGVEMVFPITIQWEDK